MRGRTTVILVGAALGLSASLAALEPTERFRDETPIVKTVVPPTGGMGELTGGPDGFGYTFTDSNEAGGPTAGLFMDISGTGTPVALGDDAEQSVPIGFSFPFYTGSYANVFIVSNGFLSFDAGASGAFTNDCPFDAGSPPNLVAPYWDDLDPGDDGALAYHQTFGDCPVDPPGVDPAAGCFVAQWEEFDFFPGNGTPGGTAGTFQALLYEGGDMLIQYEGGAGLTGSSATIGISNDGAANSLQYTCNSPSVAAGLAIQYVAGGFGDLAITKTGDLVLGGNTVYTIEVTNNGPDDQTGVVVTDTLAPELAFVGDNCGGSAAGQNWTWNVGGLAAGATVSCELTAEFLGVDCATVRNSATVVGDLGDPAGNNTSTVSNGGGNAVADPGFELGTPNADWNEASTNFGTPICDVGSCGTGTGTGPRTGLFWTWFGGIAAFEEGSVSQDVDMTGATDLTFWLEAIVCASPADFVEVTIDGNQVWTVNGSWAGCGTLGYSQQTVDVSAYNDGVHTLAFHSITFGSGNTNFFIDDVELISQPTCAEPPAGVNEIPTLSTTGVVVMVLVLGLAAGVLLRRQQLG